MLLPTPTPTNTLQHLSRRPSSRAFLRWSFVAGLSALSLVALPEMAAKADEVRINRPFVGKRPLLLDFHAGLYPGSLLYGFGGLFGARVSFPIVHNGFVPKINNAVHITTGLDVGFFRFNRNDGAAVIAVPVLLNWEFYFTNKWSAFAEAGVGIMPYFHDGVHFWPWGWGIFGVGGRFHINQRVGLVLRVGSPSTTFGVTIKF